MTLLLVVSTIVVFIVAMILTVILARKRTKPSRSYAITPNCLEVEGDISLEDAMKYLKLVNLK